jgi:copper chaperone CopZ
MMNRIQTIAGMFLLTVSFTSAAATIEMTVNGLVCAFCAQGIEKKLKKFPATAAVIVSLEHRLVAIDLKPGRDISDDELRKALTDAGYTVKAIARTEASMADIRARIKQSGHE